MILLRSTKSKIIKNENGENVPYLEITELVLVHCSIVNNYYQENSRDCLHMFLINRLVNYKIFHQKILYF